MRRMAVLRGSLLLLLFAGSASAVQFGSLSDLETGIGFTTVVAIGPEDPDPATTGDGCIYAVNGGSGVVRRVCFDAAKNVTSTADVVDLLGGGSVNNVLGITVDPASPPGEIHLYIAYAPTNTAPFQGRIARATGVPFAPTYTVDETFITGLARSAFDHQTNGLDFGPDGCLYIAQGNNSNAGYDNAFAESRLSSAVLRACFKLPDGSVDPAFDRNCGGGELQEACDVEVYASGLRNPYDLVWHTNGELYLTDNDANPGFRDDCGNEANNFGCGCEEPANSPVGDEINRIVQGRYYGSPNPFRANPSGLQCQGGSDAGDACAVDGDCNGGTCEDLSALCTDSLCGEAAQCFYFAETAGDGPQAGEDPNSLYEPPIDQTVASTLDGMDEYHFRHAATLGGTFCSDWDGDLLVTAGPGALRRYSVTPDGLDVVHEGTGNLNGATGLDVVVGEDGTIFVADLNGGKVTYIEPISQPDPGSPDYFTACAVGESCEAGVCVPLATACANPPPGDPDCDGLGPGVDRCPGDPFNRCAGPTATCASAPPGSQVCTLGDPLALDIGATAPQVDCNGDTWFAETGLATGTDYPGNVPIAVAPVEAAFGCTVNGDGTTTLVSSQKYANPLTRSYPVINGTYVVNLVFAEVFDGACVAGSRTVDATLEGVQVLGGPVVGDGFDIYAASEAQNGTTDACGGLVIRSFETLVSDGALDLSLTEDDPATGDGNAALQAIEVVRVEDCSVDADCDDAQTCTTDTCNLGTCENVPLGDGAACDDGDPNTTGDICTSGVCAGQSSDPDNDGLAGLDPCPSDPRNLCFAPVATDGDGPDDVPGNGDDNAAIRINASEGVASSGQKTDCNGDVWAADFGANQGNASECNLPGGCPIIGIDTIFGCTDALTEDIFQGERWDEAAAPELIYDFDVADGTFLVNLYFANSYTGTEAVGTRIFDVLAEGQLFLDDFDQVVAAGGSGAAVVRSLLVEVSDGDGLQIEFIHGVENPSIKAIEVLGPAPLGSCVVDSQCDDSSECTQDFCDSGTCVNDPSPFQGMTCDDGVSCTFGDACNAGVCDPGIPDDQQCDDGNSCTADACDILLDCTFTPLLDGTGCDDGVACTGVDVCTSGQCGGPDLCTGGQVCNATSGICEDPVIPGEAFVSVTPTAGISGSTFDPGSFSVQNTSPVGGPTIDLVRFDLSSAFLPDMVFDPTDGTPAGDATSKCLEIDSGGTETGYSVPADPCLTPFSIAHDNGYDQMVLFFSPGTFESGEEITFSIDIDPTSIQGAPGSGGAGSVSGFEIAGATVTVKFDDGTTVVSTLMRTPGSDGGSQNVFAPIGPLPPGIEVLGVPSTPIAVPNAAQTVRLTGPAGAPVRLVVAEGEFDTGGNPPFDPDPFEANAAVAITDIPANIGPGGFVDIPVTLTDSTANGGFNHLFAAIEDTLATNQGSVRTSSISNVIVLELDANASSGQALYRINAGGPQVAATDGGIDWAEDSSANPSPYRVTGTNDTAAFTITTFDGTVPPTTPTEVYQTERYEAPGGEEMSWAFPVTPGSYEVRLYFANGYEGTSTIGTRVYDVSIEGNLVLDDFDIIADTGHLIGFMKSFVVTSDANLDIDFAHVVENPLVNAIEIIPVNADGFLGAGPSNLDFGLVEIATSSAPQSVVLTNLGDVGDSTIDITSLTAMGEFSIAPVALPVALAPGDSLQVDVTFDPTVVGVAADTLTILHDGNNSPVTIPLAGEGFDPSAIPISFSTSNLQGESSSNPTSLDFGPDDRLYVAQQDGAIFAYTIQRVGPDNYQVIDSEEISLVQDIPNHDDTGGLDSPTTRQVTGLLATGTPANPVLYVTSSDPRIGAGGGGNDLNLDTNSGVISRLTWNGSSWDHVQLVRGLPRSEENHSTNGMALDPSGTVLYVMSGGLTNKGAPGNNFAQTQEYALSGAMLSVDLAAIGAMPIDTDGNGQDFIYDIPTLDDPTRGTPGLPDPGDPFGGNDGRNQARIVTGGPVQIFSPGYRNPYDVVYTQAGRIYTIDNGPNTGWGGVPIGNGTPNCTNETNEATSTGYGDGLHLVTQGYYGGHPHPTRGNPTTSDLVIYENPGGGWVEVERYDWQADFPDPPVPFTDADPRQCEYLIPQSQDGALAVVNASTNGLAEYTASNFSTAMQGDLLAAAFNGNVWRFELNAAGDTVVNGGGAGEILFTGFGSQPLDVITQGDGDPFPGTVWVAVFGSGTIAVFEPVDFSSCTGVYDIGIDEDGDGFSNADEIDNGADPCSAGSQPPDNDGDDLSDLNDPDDDNDGILDVADAFAIDPDNGLTTNLPVNLPFFNAIPGTGFFGLGLTGLMIDGATDYLTQFDEALIDAGGAAGLFAFNAVTAGDAYQANNDQDNAFQLGVNVDDTSSVFSVQLRLQSPYFEVGGNPSPATDFQSFGLQVGTGHQDDYLKVVFNANGGAGGVQVLLEDGGTTTATNYDSTVVGDILGSIFVDLYLTIDPGALTAQAAVSLDGGPIVPLGSPVAIPAAWLDGLDAQGLAVGVISTSFGSGLDFSAVFDLLDITPGPAGTVCLVDSDCDDGNACTADVCSAGQCTTSGFEPAGTSCEADADLCTIDVCDGAGTCGNQGDVECTGLGEVCDSSTGACAVPSTDLDGDGLIGFDPCPLEVRNACFGPPATDPLGPDGLPATGDEGNAIRVNASAGLGASGARTDCNGDLWVADYGFNQGNSFECNLNGGGEACVISGIPQIFGCEDDATEDLFQGERWDETADPELLYSFPVVDGDYLVNLYFANIFDGTAAVGTRTFDVAIEGNTVAMDFDQVAAAGGSGIAVVRSFSATVSDGNGIQIELLHGVENPSLKAIEILEAAPPPCTVDADCDDANVCTNETCNAGSCEYTAVPDATPCDDGIACTFSDQCTAGVCDGLPDDAVCDDSELCTADACVAGLGCVNDAAAYDGVICDDGDPGTFGDVCSAGVCSGDVVTCDSVVVSESFDVDPSDWVDTAGDNSPTIQEGFVGGVDVDGELVFSATTTETNAHSHLVSPATEFLTNYAFTGRGRIDPGGGWGGGWGVTFGSDYPVGGSFGDHYYRLRRWSGFGELHISPHGTTVDCGPGGIGTGFSPTNGEWFRFRVELEDTGTETLVRAWVWNDGDPQPAQANVECVDATATRRTSGTIGVWTLGDNGPRYWDDFEVTTLGEPSCDDGNLCNGAETCVAGICQPGTPLACDDGDACTIDVCDAVAGCAVAGPVNCDDGNACTIDTCDSALGCANDPDVGASCDVDDDLCSLDTCDAVGACVAGAPVACGPNELCNPASGVCEALAACANPPVGDADCDGIPDATDPCPADLRNRCLGSAATCAADGGNCSAGGDLRFDVGSTAPTTDCNGLLWGAETGAGLGSEFNGNVSADSAAITNVFGCSDAATEAMILSETYGNPLTRSYPVADGAYQVNLYFAEAFDGVCGTPGSRTCDLTLEGVQVLGGPAVGDGFDQFAVAAAENGTGSPAGCGSVVVRSFQTLVSDGTIDLSLVEDDPATGDGNCAVKAIEILAVDECSVDADCEDGSACTVNTCNGGMCQTANVADGTACDDGSACTLGDACVSGVCEGGPVTCPSGTVCLEPSGLCQVPTAEALVAVTPGGPIDATTFSGDAFQITNASLDGEEIVRVSIDFSTGIYRDIVFDPDDGTPAGDAASSCLTPTVGAAATGYVVTADPCADPYFSPNELGYFGVELEFSDFQPGEFFAFNTDVDPTTIQGGVSTGAAGAVSGLEVTGATVTVEFDDGTIAVTDLYPPQGDVGGSQALVRPLVPATPTLEVLGHPAVPTTVTSASQTIRVGAPAGSVVRLLQTEAIRELVGAPGFDIEPFEGNETVAVGHFQAEVPAGGFVDFPVTLTQAVAGPDDDDVGLNHFVAVVADGPSFGAATGPNSNVAILRLDPLAVACDTCDDGLYCNGFESCDDQGACQAGTAVVCSDGITCTVDSCNEATDSCDAVPSDALCSDGLFCNGDEVCSTVVGCQAGAPVVCLDDGVSCTDEVCNESIDSCEAVPDDALCDNGLFCDGAETCDPLLDCQPGAGDPCPAGSACDEALDLCDPCPNDADCDGIDDGSDLCPNDPLNMCAGVTPATCLAATGNCGAAGQEIRFDAGPGSPVTDCNGDVWQSEAGAGLGNNSAGSGSVVVDASSVQRVFGCTDAATEDMLKTERYASPLSRSYPVPNGEYAVSLFFLESFQGACDAGVGFRIFDVFVEGVEVLADFDQFATSLAENGVGCGALVVKTFQTTVADGTLDVSLVPDAASVDGNAALKAIKVGALPAACSVDGDCDDGNPCSVDTCGSQGFCESTLEPDGTTCDDGDVCSQDDECTAGVCGGIADSDNDGLGDVQLPECLPDPCPDEPLNECYGSIALDALGPDGLPSTGDDDSPIRVNTGPTCAVDFTDCRGEPWFADFGYTSEQSTSTCNLPGGCPVDATSVFGCTDMLTEVMFTCEHWDPPADPELVYTFEVPDGEYLVNLLFMNGYTGTDAPGSRVFDVALEGVVPPQLDDFDQIVAAGGSLPVNRSAIVDVSDGNGLQIEFLHQGVENPAVNGIEVRAMPEPGVLASLVFGFAAVGALSRRRARRCAREGATGRDPTGAP